jgi:uncharacterized protein with HEPN domain
MPAERDERVYLGDILSAIERAIAYTKGGRQEFLADSKTQDAVIRNIRVIHGYFRVDLDIVWDIVEKELPTLRQQFADLLARH